ncbi:glycosyltransferase [Paludibacter sp. 221]|nr:glycosyltransferase [Paludibacter sp. 221]
MDGVALAVSNYAYWLHEKNYPVCVVAPNAPDYEDDEVYPVFRYTSVPVPTRKPYRLGLPDIDFSFQKKFEEIKFELVHAHSPFSAGKLAVRVAKEQKVPLIATFHSKYRDDFERALHSRHVVDLMVKEIVSFYEKADEVWVPQKAVEETLREYGYKGKIEVVDNGNDFATDEDLAPVKQRAREALGVKGDEFVFLFVGQHIWEKNTRMIVEALALMKDEPFRMFFVGTGYAADELKTLVKEAGLSSKVTFTGIVTDRERIKLYYAASDLFLFPSLYDNAPLVVREAGALGTPSVMVAGSTAAEILTDNLNGFLIENSAKSLAEKLRGLIKNPDLVKEVGINASKTIANSWKSIVEEEVLDRYLSIIRRKKT